MNVKLTALTILVVVTLLQGCTVVRLATAPIRYTAHQVGKARAEKRGERRGEERAEKRAEKDAEERPAPPSHIDRPDAPPPETPAN